MSFKKIFLSSLVTKLENLYCFWEEFMKNQLKRMISKKVADQSHFGSNIESLFYTESYGWFLSGGNADASHTVY